SKIYLDGEPLLDLPGLLRYRISGDMEARIKKLRALGQPVVQRLVQHMVQRDAGQRKSVKEYISRMEKVGMLFPQSFSFFLFPLLARMHTGRVAPVLSPDERLRLVTENYGRAMRELAGVPDPEGHALFQAAL
ncbi:unnamed protein product, partial [Discosporangium mesarthrocarpum]